MSPQGVHGVAPEPSLEYSEFFRKHFPRLVKALAVVGATTEEAQDVVQEAMVELLFIWPNCRYPYAWVRKVAWHKYLGTVAGERRRQEKEREARIASFTPVEPVEPDEGAWVRQLLSELPARQRAVLALFVDGYSNAEIAALLAMDAGTVRSNLRHARNTLRTRLEGHGSKDES
ncbi:MAG TPA: RNA polymerase sigma factor [Streptomyces sp.]|nr:RNA polymerase sigma factor [Streptomyces sp.]